MEQPLMLLNVVTMPTGRELQPDQTTARQGGKRFSPLPALYIRRQALVLPELTKTLHSASHTRYHGHWMEQCRAGPSAFPVSPVPMRVVTVNLPSSRSTWRTML